MQHPQILEFYQLDLDDNTLVDRKQLHVQETGGRQLTLHHNDILRLQIHKSYFKQFRDKFDSIFWGAAAGGKPVVSLYGKTSCDASPAVIKQVGTISRLESEKYFEIVLLFRSIPSGYAQFSLIRENGTEAFGTFKEQHATKARYIQAVADWFESYPYTPIDADVDGDYLRLRIYRISNSAQFVSSGTTYQEVNYLDDPNWFIENEALSVSIGSVTDFNTNTPTITKVFKGTETIAAKKILDLEISADIQDGNIFRFGELSYRANNFDTPETIKSYFFGGAIQYSALQTENTSVSVEKGYTRRANTNIGKINALYYQNSGGKDWYTVEVDNIAVGNIFTLFENGTPTRSYTVADGDTASDVEDFFNNESGYMKVNENRSVEMKFTQGQQLIENTNNPSIKAVVLSSLAAQDVDNYDIYVGTSIKAGNIFTLGDKTVTATDEDTFSTIQTALGLEVGKYYQVPTGTSFKCTAAKGSPYGADNIPDIEIIQQPKIKTSEYVKADIILADCDSYIGDFQLVLRGEPSVTGMFRGSPYNMPYFAISQYFRLLPASPSSGVVVSFRDTGKAFDFAYFDKEDFQQLRVPGQLYDYKSEIYEEKSKDANGKEHTSRVEITQTCRFASDLLSNDQSLALTIGLKHREVFLNGRLSEIAELDQAPANSRCSNVTGLVKFKDHIWTNHNSASGYALSYIETARIKNNDSLNIFCVILKNDYFRVVLSENFDQAVQPLECFPEIFVAGTLGEQKALTATGATYKELDPMAFYAAGYCLLRIYEDGYLLVSEYVRKGHKSKLHTAVRFEKGKTYEFKTVQDYSELESYIEHTDEAFTGIDSEDYESVTYENELQT